MNANGIGMAISDGLLILGVVVMTIGVIGVVRMPDIYTKLHAASKSVFLGVMSLLIAVSAAGDAPIVARAILIALLLVVTTPVAAHEIARAATREEGYRVTRSGREPNGKRDALQA
jgi:multicomponent Na+:H+ antiporter subunit G